jgi:hypothetical protein
MKRLQIILTGWEKDRFVYGIKQKSPNKVIFISSEPSKAPNKKWGQKTTEIAEEIGQSIKSVVDYEIVFFAYHDLDSCIRKTVDLVEKNLKEFDEISVNVSSGTTLIKMAFSMVAQFYPIKLFYVIPNEYTHPCEIITTGARALVELPNIKLRKIINPNKKQKEILSLLNEEKISFTELTKKYAKLKEKKVNGEEIKQLKSWLFYHIKKMREKNLIEHEVENKTMQIWLTQTGSLIKLILEKEKKEEKQTKIKYEKERQIIEF